VAQNELAANQLSAEAVANPPGQRLSTILRADRDEIVHRWMQAMEALPKARQLSKPALINHVPALLDEIADAAARPARASDGEAQNGDAVEHAVQRLDAGFDLEEVAYEYSLLRTIIFQRLETESAPVSTSSLRFLNEAIDGALGRAVAAYATIQQRTLRALDRISEAALGTLDLEAMLLRLLQVFVETAAPVDTVTILLREQDRLRVRASVGAEAEVRRGFSLRIGEGFSGTIAKERRPLLIEDPSKNPIVKSPDLRAENLKILYGVPLIDCDSVIGVMHMGSRSATGFSDEQQLIFRMLATRATLMIAQVLSVAREQASHLTARVLAASDTLDEAMPRLIAAIGDAFKWDAGIYWQHVPRAHVLCYASGWTAPGIELPVFIRTSHTQEFARGVGLPGRAWESGAVEWIAEFADDGNFPRGGPALQDGLRSGIAIPLSTGEETLGVIEFLSRTRRARGEEAVQMTAVLAQQLPPFLRRIRAQDLVRTNEMQKAAILDVALDCIVSMNAKGLVTAWNAAAERTFGYSPAEAIGHDLADLIIPEHLRSAHREGIVRYLATGEHHHLNRRLETPAMRRDGTQIVVELAIARVPTCGPALFTGFMRDITDARRADEEQARLHAQAREASRLRELLLAVVSHDLRNPLSAITAATSVLMKSDSQISPTARRSFETILRSTARMDRLIGDLLDTTQIQTGRLSVDRRPHRIDRLVEDAVGLHRLLFSEKHIDVAVDVTTGDLECDCDRERVLQVFANLLGNALKFCKHGDSVVVTANQRDSDVLFEVRDTGPGIPADHLLRIFEPYWSGTRDRRGTGLGLFISKGIVEAHGGTLSAESKLGSGSTFGFVLPLA
jgi:PAS domain S-box-containing protein